MNRQLEGLEAVRQIRKVVALGGHFMLTVSVPQFFLLVGGFYDYALKQVVNYYCTCTDQSVRDAGSQA
jgi:hypothetical protein